VRLLVVSSAFPCEGDPSADIWVLRQCQTLAERGHEIRVAYVVPLAPPFRSKWRAYRAIPYEYTYEGIRVNAIRAIVPPKMLGFRFVRMQFQAALRAIITEFQPALVHVNCLIPPGFLAIGLDRPVVLTAHGSDAYVYPRQRADLGRAAAAAIQAASAVVAVSAFVRREVERLGGHAVRVVFNGADPRVFSRHDRTTARRALNLPDHTPMIAYAGTIHRSKGLFDLVEAVRGLSDLQPLVVIAGRGPHVTDVMKSFETAGLQAKFVGLLAQNDVANLLSAADVVTLPSYGEGLPTVLCEAMLSGRAVVATDVGGIPEIVRNNETGFVVPVGDHKAMTTSLRSILTNSELRVRLEDNAHQFAAQNLTWSVNAQAYEEIYADVLRRHRVSR
jgi:teichuronic acid biosynthesis glycosyltransferase TuaC